MISHDKFDGSTRKSQVLHIVFPSQNKLNVHRTNLQKLRQSTPSAKEKLRVAGDGVFPFFCFFTLIKLRQQKVAQVFIISHLEKLKNYRGINLLVPHIGPNTQ